MVEDSSACALNINTISSAVTLEAYTDIYSNMVQYLAPVTTAAPPAGPSPPNQISKEISLQVRLGTVYVFLAV